MYEGPLRTNVKSVKTSILVLKVIQSHCFRCQSKPVYDFLLVINNCNLGPITHRFRDMASYWFKIAKFSYPLSPMEFLEKRYRSWNYSLWGSRWWRFDDPSLHRFCLIHPCDTQTDRQTELRRLRRAIAVPAVARKKSYTLPKITKSCKSYECNIITDMR